MKAIFQDKGIQIFLTLGFLALFAISSFVNIPLAFDGTMPYDFPNYYFGGLRFLEGRPIYDFLEGEVFQTLGWHNRVYPADPPFAVIVLSPLSYLSYFQAWIVWAVISTLLLVTSIYLAAKELDIKPTAAFLAVSIALSSKPFRFLLFSNHIETLVLALSVVGWILLRRSYFRTGLFIWVLAASVKLFPLLWIVGSIKVVGLRKVLEAILAFALIFIISGCLAGLDNLHTFLFEIIARSQLWYGTIANYSLISFGYALNSPILGWSLEICFALLVALVLLSDISRNIDRLWSFVTIASLMLSPLCWWRYLILVLPCLMVFLYSANFHLSRPLKYLIVLSGFVLWGWPEIINVGSTTGTVLLSFVPLGVLVFLCSISASLRLEQVGSR